MGLSLYASFFKGDQRSWESKVNALETAFEIRWTQIEREIKETREQIPSIAINGRPVAGPAAFAAENERLLTVASEKERRTQLSSDAVEVSKELLELIKRLGPAPPPKYTREELGRMTTAQEKKLIDAQDGDYAEATAFHYGDDRCFRQTQEGVYNNIMARELRLVPFYRKLEASYALEFEQRVRELNWRFIIEGIFDDALMLPVQGMKGAEHIQQIASKLRELAFQLEAKGVSSEGA